MARQQAGRPSSKKLGSQAGSKRNQKGSRKPAYGQTKKPQKQSLFDDRTKRDILSVCLIVLSIALFVTALMPSTGMVTSLVSTGLHHAFGVGIYILPFILFALAVLFLIRFEKERVPARAAIGFALIFVAVLVLFALGTPGAEQDPNILFKERMLLPRGGYLGAGIAWLGLNLFGPTVSIILMVGLIVLALVIIGFSLSGLIEKLRTASTSSEDADDCKEDSFAHLPNLRIRKQANSERNPTKESGINALQTQAIDAVELRGQKTNKLGSKKKMNSQKTMVLPEVSADKPVNKQMTRKLGVTKTEEAPKQVPKRRVQQSAIPKPLEGFELPDPALLYTSNKDSHSKESETTLRSTALLLQETLADFGVNAEVVGWVPGPTVTLFKVDLPSGVRVSRVSNLQDDISLALAAPGVRIFAPVPGTNFVGIEVPNKERETVLLGDVLKDAPVGPLQIAIGKDVEGESIVSDLATMPHLLIGGTTGSGKSVSINGMIMSILMRATPAEVRFIMIDPKRVEFTPYNGIPHLYVPVVTESKEAASALAWAVAEMERRLKIFSSVGARNIGQYNAKAQNGLEIEGSTAHEMPYIVIIIDELADLMMNVGKEVEFSISRLAQLARAAGIHLIVATQRPSTNVVTGLIKANITNRIAFNVASGIDSRVILDTPGAENLIGLGDLLLSKPELARPQRIQGCYVSEDEISAVVEKLKEQGEPEYHNDILKTNLMTLGDTAPDGGPRGAGGDDPLLWEAADIVCSSGVGSTSNLQRRLSVGYSRAGRIMDLLEEKGIVGPQNGSKPREVLVDSLELETIKAFELKDNE